MEVKLVSASFAAQTTCAKAAALCTGIQDHDRALRAAMGSGHESIAEHAAFTFLVEGVSRVLLAQLTRHRIASFSVSSQRYIRIVDADIICPESVKQNGWEDNFKKVARDAVNLYQLMADNNVPIEDSRYILPQGVTCSLMMTMNPRELRHFFSLRCCSRAQWEIRELADKMLAQCKRTAPQLFKDAGPGCVRGHCPEKRPCGHPRKNEMEETNNGN